MEKLFLLSLWCRPAAPPELCDLQFIDEQMALICPAVTSFQAMVSTASETHTVSLMMFIRRFTAIPDNSGYCLMLFTAGLVSLLTRPTALLDWRTAVLIASSAEASFGSTQTSLYKLKCSCVKSYLRIMTHQLFLSFYYSHLLVWHLRQ